MNYLDIINSVMRKIREDEVTASTDSDYAKLIGDFVLATKREVESAWNWTSLRTSINVPTVQSTSAYSLTGAGKRYTILDVYNVTQSLYIDRMMSVLGRRDIVVATEGQPNKYFIEGIDASGDPKINFVPIPDGVYSINVGIVIPQTDTLSDTTELTMDEWPLILGAYSKAVSERGEDSGRTSGEAQAAYQAAISDSIALDVARTQGEDEWYV